MPQRHAVGMGLRTLVPAQWLNLSTINGIAGGRVRLSPDLPSGEPFRRRSHWRDGMKPAKASL